MPSYEDCETQAGLHFTVPPWPLCALLLLFCAGENMFNDPRRFVNNKSGRHLKNSWKQQSERSKFVVKGNKHLKEVEHLKKALEAKHAQYLKEEGESAVLCSTNI